MKGRITPTRSAATLFSLLLTCRALPGAPGPSKNPGRKTADAGPVTAAQLQSQQKPKYPEGLAKIQKQGNVVMSGRLDANGRIQDIVAIVATNLGFVDPAIAAVRAWQFKPATRGGKAIDISINVGMRFRQDGAKRGEIPRAILGDLSVFPANASGGKAAPEGFPLRRGGDPRLRVEAVLDVPPSATAQKLALRADAVSPTGRRVNLYSATVPAPAKATEVPISFSASVGGDWEDGIWTIQMTLSDVPAGGGQFWLAGDPEHFDFRAQAARNAAVAANLPPAAVPGPTPKPGAAKAPPTRPAASRPKKV